VHAARERINALNPRVEVVASTNMQDLQSESALQAYDLVVLTDSDSATVVSDILPSLVNSTNAIIRIAQMTFVAS
jgi:hypothetical protein